VLVLGVAGCSGVGAGTTAAPTDPKPFQLKRGGISISADPYFTTDRIVRLFYGGDRFAESGVLPVQLAIENGSGREIKVNPRDSRLVRPNSMGEAPLAAQDAFSLVKVRMQYWALLPVIGASVTAARNSPVLKDLESRELREATIPPGGMATGFVYFRIPEEQRDLAGYVVVVVVEGFSGQDPTYVIPIEGRRGMPGASNAPQADRRSPHPTPPPERGREREGGSGVTRSSDPSRIEGAGGGVIIRSPAP
jgi:hypothetical protein